MGHVGNGHCTIPKLKLQFYTEYHHWFTPTTVPVTIKTIQVKMVDGEWPRAGEVCSDCKRAEARGNRTVGLFKAEYSNGTWFVGLCSKTYAIGVDETTNNMKASAKGINLKLSKIKKKHFVGVLDQQKSTFGLLKGIKVKDQSVVTYTQKRFGLSFFYAKRICLANSYETQVLDI